MAKQFIFSALLIVTLGIFTYTVKNIIALFKLTKKTEPLTQVKKRIILTLKVAFGQTKILNKPLIGFMHALVFWGFLVITVGSIEMVFDGILGTQRLFGNLGVIYTIVIASGDVFAYLIIIAVSAFIGRRLFLKIKRFNGIELTRKNRLDANFALTLILLLMISLVALNIYYLANNQSIILGYYPISYLIAQYIAPSHVMHEISWWSHILLIFFFANYLPYSKHFHVFMSIPNVYASNLEPLAMVQSSENITPVRFGVKDIEDISRKNFMDALTCTQCGRCAEVCPANITGKKLSPRKIIVDLRTRMNEKGSQLLNNKAFSDGKSLINDYISPEEIWACTLCNACAQACPLNISQPNLIMDMRRYLVLEEGKAPSGINTMFANIENNGAPWPFSQDERLNWTVD
jgi:heterodisulfide reductase subunit C